MSGEAAVPDDTRGESYADKTQEFVMKLCIQKGDTQSMALLVGLLAISESISELATAVENVATSLG